ncbi:MAG TPA: phospholipase D-like domain-containing protein [Chitinophagaceae bacterium]|nr:phospholipase D-like domain-containing protein [Chitinophagaceae bacterium]
MSFRKSIKKSGYSFRNRVRLVRGGKEYFSFLKKLIDEAEISIHLQFYIFLEDETGTMVMEALKAASLRGVQVFLHLDGYASQKLPRRCVRDMRDAGVLVKWFEPLFRSKHFYFGRRLHHKVVVADGLYSLVGGINVCNRYNDMPDEPAWLDMALYCEGEASFALYKECRNLWGDREKFQPVSPNDIDSHCKLIPSNELVQVRVRRNDWVKRKNEVWRTYLNMFIKAEKQITIMCSYFLPGRLFRKKLAQAAKKGVSIKVILAGTSDIMMAKHAERYLYDWLLKNNIEIYEYQDTVLHAKMAACDGHWVTVGSYNVNNISAYASLELNMDVNDNSFAQQSENILNDIQINHCKQITRENYVSSTHFFRRIWQRFCYWFINNTLNLFTFYFRQEE